MLLTTYIGHVQIHSGKQCDLISLVHKRQFNLRIDRHDPVLFSGIGLV